MLLGNYSVFLKSPGTFRAGSSISDNPSNYDRTNANRNRFLHFSPYNGEPVGYTFPYSWQMAVKAGGMSTSTGLNVTLTNTGNLAAGINIDAALDATFSTVSISGSLIVEILASLTADGTLTDAGLILLADLTTTVTAQLTTTSAIIEAIQVANAIATLSAQGTLNAPTLGALLGTAANLTATISPNAVLSALAGVSSNITPFTELSPQSLSDAVLNSLLANYTTPGTFGEALSSSSGISIGDLNSAKTEIINKISTSTKTSKYY
jgi:hypothetical protein